MSTLSQFFPYRQTFESGSLSHINVFDSSTPGYTVNYGTKAIIAAYSGGGGGGGGASGGAAPNVSNTPTDYAGGGGGAGSNSFGYLYVNLPGQPISFGVTVGAGGTGGAGGTPGAPGQGSSGTTSTTSVTSPIGNMSIASGYGQYGVREPSPQAGGLSIAGTTSHNFAGVIESQFMTKTGGKGGEATVTTNLSVGGGGGGGISGDGSIGTNIPGTPYGVAVGGAGGSSATSNETSNMGYSTFKNVYNLPPTTVLESDLYLPQRTPDGRSSVFLKNATEYTSTTKSFLNYYNTYNSSLETGAGGVGGSSGPGSPGIAAQTGGTTTQSIPLFRIGAAGGGGGGGNSYSAGTGAAGGKGVQGCVIIETFFK